MKKPNEMSWEFLEELLDSSLPHEEIAEEVQTKFHMDRQQALTVIQSVCRDYADGAPDAAPSHQAAANLEAWASQAERARHE